MQEPSVSKPLFDISEMRRYSETSNKGLARMLMEQEDAPEAVGARLKKVREILELDQKEFAARAGILPQTYGPFELAKRPLSLDAAKKLRKTYQIPLEFMYFGKIDDLPTRISAKL